MILFQKKFSENFQIARFHFKSIEEVQISTKQVIKSDLGDSLFWAKIMRESTKN